MNSLQVYIQVSASTVRLYKKPLNTFDLIKLIFKGKFISYTLFVVSLTLWCLCLWTIYEKHTHQLGGYKHGTKPYRALKQFRPVRGISMECPHPTQERGWARGARRGQEVSGVAKRVQEKA